MDIYMSLNEFASATNNAPMRKVLHGGAVYMCGRRYEHDELLHYVGHYVRVFVDVNEAFAVCLTLFGKRYICNARNPELWAEMLMDAGIETQTH